MSMTYKLMERLAKNIDLKKKFSLPEREVLQYLRTEWRTTDLPDYIYRRFTVEKITIDRRPMFRIRPKTVNTHANTILFIHGGGGMMCPTEFHFRFAARMVQGCGATLYFPFYPLAPESNLPAASRFLDKAYDYVIKREGAARLTLIGDSAGAGLAAAVCARTPKKPRGIVMISPGVGVEKNDAPMKALEPDDIIMSCRMLDIIKKYWSGGIDPASPEFTPTYVDYTGFPPILLYYGTHEIFYPHIPKLIAAIQRADVPLKTVEGKGLCHDWAIIGLFDESRRASEEIIRFVGNPRSVVK